MLYQALISFIQATACQRAFVGHAPPVKREALKEMHLLEVNKPRHNRNVRRAVGPEQSY